MELQPTCHAAFGGLVTAVAVWSIYGGDMFPAAADPTGNPEEWTREEMRRWLAAVGLSAAVLVWGSFAHRRAAQPVPRRRGDARGAPR